jgi:hypothetical protein
VADISPDLILITETWCNSDIADAFLSIPWYDLLPDLRVDRADTGGGRGGGIVVYAKQGLQILKIDQDVTLCQMCKFLVNDVELYVLYRPPNAVSDSVSEIADIVRQAKKNSIFIGDFNLPEIDWSAGVARGRASLLLEAVEESMTEQLVNFPTHLKGNTLDLVITNMPERVEEIVEGGRLGRSDHMAILARVSVGQTAEEDKGPVPNWNRADWEGMREELRNTRWRRELDGATAERAWSIFRDKVTKLVEEHVPIKKRRDQNKPAWMTREILRAVRKKKRLWKKVRNGVITDEYRQAEKTVKKLIQGAKRGFEKRLAAGGNRNKRPFYAYVKQRTRSRPAVGPLKTSDGRKLTDTVEMADLLNETFNAVFTREDTTNVPEPEVKKVRENLETVHFSVAKVREKIRQLRADAAAGPDGIGPKLLRELAEGLAPALTTIFNKSMETSEVPADWREANVTPIFKKGAKSDPGNYRPVSLTSVCCKLMETVVRDSVTHHLTVNKLVSKSQHGFMRGRSCATNLLEFVESATAAVDRGEAFDIVYLDFAKAFDKVPHERLVKKLQAHGVHGKLLAWVKN